MKIKFKNTLFHAVINNNSIRIVYDHDHLHIIANCVFNTVTDELFFRLFDDQNNLLAESTSLSIWRLGNEKCCTALLEMWHELMLDAPIGDIQFLEFITIANDNPIHNIFEANLKYFRQINAGKWISHEKLSKVIDDLNINIPQLSFELETTELIPNQHINSWLVGKNKLAPLVSIKIPVDCMIPNTQRQIELESINHQKALPFRKWRIH